MSGGRWHEVEPLYKTFLIRSGCDVARDEVFSSCLAAMCSRTIVHSRLCAPGASCALLRGLRGFFVSCEFVVDV